MIKVAFFASLWVALVAAAPSTPAPPNGIRQCARSECPVYTLLEDYGLGITRRRVEPGLWVSKVAPTCNRTTAVGMIYFDLHSYFTNNNITRTTPIIIETTENKARPSFCPDQSDEFPCCEEIFTLQFYVPLASQATAPPPAKELGGVQLLNAAQPRDFFVVAFSGRPTLQSTTQKYNELVSYLQSEDLAFEDDTFSLAIYDAPTRPLPHLNEVFIPIKNCNRGRGCGGNRDRQQGRGNGEGRGHGNGEGRGRGDSGTGHRQRRALQSELDNVDLLPFDF